jgi:hypothetical protein
LKISQPRNFVVEFYPGFLNKKNSIIQPKFFNSKNFFARKKPHSNPRKQSKMNTITNQLKHDRLIQLSSLFSTIKLAYEPLLHILLSPSNFYPLSLLAFWVAYLALIFWKRNERGQMFDLICGAILILTLGQVGLELFCG